MTAGDGLDRKAVRRRAGAAEYSSQAIHQYESAADVPALLDALEAAEAEVVRLREYVAYLTGGAVVKVDGRAVRKDVLRTEGGAS